MTKEEIIQNYSSLSLAYVGDAVYELLVRTHLFKDGDTPNGVMHKRARDYVSASAQNRLLGIISDSLTEQESGVVRRGRNVKSHSHPKNADLAEYHNATGFEALFGFLHLAGDNERIKELFDIIARSEQ